MEALDHDDCCKDIRWSQIQYIILGLKVVKDDKGDFGKFPTGYKSLDTTHDTACDCRLQFGQALSGNTFSLVVVVVDAFGNQQGRRSPAPTTDSVTLNIHKTQDGIRYINSMSDYQNT